MKNINDLFIKNNINNDDLFEIINNFSLDKKDDLIKKNIKKCYECNSNNIILSSYNGIILCENCGMQFSQMLDDSPEWNNYDDNNASSGRCGVQINPFFPNASLCTTINISGYSKIKMLKNWNNVTYKERSLAENFIEIENKCKKYTGGNISKALIDNTKIFFKIIKDMKHQFGLNKGKSLIIRGINKYQIIAACFFYGAMLEKSSRSLNEVAAIFNLTTKQVTKGNRNFLELMKDHHILRDLKPPKGLDFIERYGLKLKLSRETINLAKVISNNIYMLGISSDHQATSSAAATIFLAGNILDENISRKLIAQVFGISEVTIMKTYKPLCLYQKFLINDETNIKNIISNNIPSDEYSFDEYSFKEIMLDESDTKKSILDNYNSLDESSLDESDVIKKDNNKKDLKNKKKFIKNPKPISLEKKKRGRPRKIIDELPNINNNSNIDLLTFEIKNKTKTKTKNNNNDSISNNSNILII